MNISVEQLEDMQKKCGEIFINEHENFTFLCIFCSTISKDVETFKAHIKIQHCKPKEEEKEDDAQLDSCKMKYGDEEQSEGNPYECDICGTHFSIESDYKIHLKVHEKKTNRREYFSRTCKKRSKLPEPSNDIDFHSPTNGKKDSQIEQVIIENVNVKSEILNYSDEKGKGQYEQLLSENDDDDNDEEISPTKENKLSKRTSVSKTQNTKISLSCEICNEIFSKKSILQSHLKYDHTPSRPLNQETTERLPLNDPFECRYCKRKCRTRKDRFEHECSHTGERPYECEICGKRYSKKYLVKKHKLKFHKKEKPFKCKICEADFTTRSNLTNHMNRHKYEKRFKCRHCGKMFARKANKDVHERAHTGEKPFQCSQCGLCVISSSELRVHTIRYHYNDKEKPYKCQYCERPFSANREKKEHERIHTGEKPFICEICSASFRTGRSLKNHKKTHTEKS